MLTYPVTIDPGSGQSCHHSWNYVATRLKHRATDKDPWIYTTYWACAGCRALESVSREFKDVEPGYHGLVS